ncbi:MAG: alkaline phosphatase family protein, partial [Candidatus Aminicenantes bacterium]|nr:alkaline phosphatase family protein [Candidatus Aminicenantes bacterium]
RGLVVCVFETTDSILHMFYRYLDKGHPALRPGQDGLSAEVIRDLFRRMDGLVGRVAAKLGPQDLLVVMSDHGFKSFRRGVNLNSWLYRNGYLALKDGRLQSEEWFKDVDWTKTKAYALGLGGLYVNMRDRESQGVVAAGEETRRLKDELIRGLQGLRDEAKAETAITRVYDRDALPAGPYQENFPDLIIGYNIGYRASWDSVTGKVSDIVFEDNIKAWSGDHCIDPAHVPGVFFSNFKIKTQTPSIMDVAPTVLSLFGLAVPGHMDGRPLVEAARAKPAVAAPSARPEKKKKNPS